MNNKQMTYPEKHRQIEKEAKATVIFYVFCFLWWAITGWGLSDVKIYFWHLPLWFWLSVVALVFIGCAGCVVLVKKVYVDFDLGDEEDDRIESVLQTDDAPEGDVSQ